MRGWQTCPNQPLLLLACKPLPFCFHGNKTIEVAFKAVCCPFIFLLESCSLKLLLLNISILSLWHQLLYSDLPHPSSCVNRRIWRTWLHLFSSHPCPQSCSGLFFLFFLKKIIWQHKTKWLMDRDFLTVLLYHTHIIILWGKIILFYSHCFFEVSIMIISFSQIQNWALGGKLKRIVNCPSQVKPKQCCLKIQRLFFPKASFFLIHSHLVSFRQV